MAHNDHGRLWPKPGAFYQYSNVGTALLGELLARRHHLTYFQLLEQRILGPLGMHETYGSMPCEQRGDGPCAQLAKVYRRTRHRKAWIESSLWHMDGMQGAGGLRSTLGDMTIFLQAELGLLPYITPALSKAMMRSKEPIPEAEEDLAKNLCLPRKRKTKLCNNEVQPMYFGFSVDPKRLTFYQDGQTGSSQSILVLSQDGTFGLVILTNSITGTNLEEAPHIPSRLATCIMQMAGYALNGENACRKI
jgi:CubicO group peptidase (beta-lactamase class C family)